MRGAMGGALVVVSATLLVLVAGCGGAGRGDEAQPVFEAYVAYLTAESGRVTATGTPAAEKESGGLAEAPRPMRPAPAETPAGTQESAATATGWPDPTATGTRGVSPSATRRPTKTATPTGAATAGATTATETATATRTATLTLAATAAATATGTAMGTGVPTATGTPGVTATETPSPTERPAMTPVPQPGMISGRVVLDGVPVAEAVTVILEDAAYQANQETTTWMGEYRFDSVPPSAEGYQVLFALDRNPQFGYDEVVSWAWIGPIAVPNGAMVEVADLEIGLLGLQGVHPMPDAFLPAGSITPQNPLVFEWVAYPSAADYWLDLRAGSGLELVWQSGLTPGTTVAFDGVLANGGVIGAGSYWWSVSARVGDSLHLAGPLAGFTLMP